MTWCDLYRMIPFSPPKKNRFIFAVAEFDIRTDSFFFFFLRSFFFLHKKSLRLTFFCDRVHTRELTEIFFSFLKNEGWGEREKMHEKKGINQSVRMKLSVT